jgi:hypothetical protein
VKRKWLVLPVCAAPAAVAVVALLGWFAAENARQAAEDARVRDAENRVNQAIDRAKRLNQALDRAARLNEALDRAIRLKQGGPLSEELRRAVVEPKQALEEELDQAVKEHERASRELDMLRAEQARRKQSWPARLRQEVRRRTGW